MGDTADMHIDGTLCEQCGVLIDGEAPGYPRSCGGCELEYRTDEASMWPDSEVQDV